MRRWESFICVMLLCAGCVSIDRQTTVLVMHPAKDELRALVIFEGIRGATTGELKRFVESGQEFCVGRCSWLSHIDLASVPNEKEPDTAEGRIKRKAEKGTGEDSPRGFARQLPLPFLDRTDPEAIVAEFVRSGTAEVSAIRGLPNLR